MTVGTYRDRKIDADKPPMKYDSTIFIIVVLVVAGFVIFAVFILPLFPSGETYSTQFPLPPFDQNRWRGVMATAHNEFPQKSLQPLYKSTQSKSYNKMGVWPDSAAPPMLGDYMAQNSITGKVNVPLPLLSVI